MTGVKVSDLTLLNVCKLLRQIGREDHNALIYAAERDLDAAFEVEGPVDMQIDWRPPLTRLRRLEAEARDILRAHVRAMREGREA